MATTPWSLTLDCRDVGAVLPFWRVALGYADADPPSGWQSWQDWLRDNEVPEAEWGDDASLSDPEGVLPALSLLRVPERKTVKNRLHLDLKVSGGRAVEQSVREERIEAHVERLLAVGGTVLARHQGPHGLDHVVLGDPEGNELCVV